MTAKTAVKPYETSMKIDTSKASQGDLFHKLAAKTLLRYLIIIIIIIPLYSALWMLMVWPCHDTEIWKKAAATFMTTRVR